MGNFLDSQTPVLAECTQDNFNFCYLLFLYQNGHCQENKLKNTDILETRETYFYELNTFWGISVSFIPLWLP